MNSGQIDDTLNMALDVPESTREKTLDLDVGYEAETNSWELIIKYSGSLDRIVEELGISAVELLNNYAIIVIDETLIDLLASYPEVEFIEKPKRLFFEVNQGRAISCINPLQTPRYNLFGEGVLIAIIDSGIDYSHPDFRNEDGTSRIAALWDQTIPGNPPPAFHTGTLYRREQINEALETPMPQRLDIVPSVDISGHGTHVAGIAAGNGRASNDLYRGVAPKSEIIVVKLGSSVGNSFPRTSQLMEGVDFAIRFALARLQPLAINISFGNNYGSHTGRTLLESYINDAASVWKNSIVIGTGNEGAAAKHADGVLTMGTVSYVEFAVAQFEFSLNLQIWSNYYDKFDITIIAPNGVRIGPIPRILGLQQFNIGQTQVLLYYGEPTPYNRQQEIYIELVPLMDYINSGIWRIELTPRRVVVGDFDMWLPAGGITNPGTGFLIPSEFTTLTIPSTAFSAISVGAYNGYTGSLAPFSGRGYTRSNEVKPDLVAPGVDIMSASPGGGYTIRSGTSMATPFVTGSAALLMEWGISRGNDPYLYGEKLKAYLIDGARHLVIENIYPNRTLGYGALCLNNTFNNIIL